MVRLVVSLNPTRLANTLVKCLNRMAFFALITAYIPYFMPPSTPTTAAPSQ